jgi:hypothetical protein
MGQARGGKLMIIGAHCVIYSRNPEADRVFLRDVLKLPDVDAGRGWLIFGLPPSEVAVHPSDENDRHELYLLSDDIQGFVRSLREKEIECSPVHEERWGSIAYVSLPGGGKLGAYEPKHPRPPSTISGRAARKKAPARKARATRRRAGRRRG